MATHSLTLPRDLSVWWSLIREAAAGWSKHGAARLGAALAYYSIFSLGPLLLIVIATAGLVFGQDAVRGQLAAQLRGLIGLKGAEAVEAMLASAEKSEGGTLAAIVGVALLLFAAVGVVVQLKDALNTIWEVEPKPTAGLWGYVRSYVVSMAGILALGFLLLISLVLQTALSAAGSFLENAAPEVALQVVNFAISFAVVTLLFAMMFKWMPDTKIEWRDVWVGAAATALLFNAGKFAIGFYVGKQGIESTYGAAASLVVLLVWVYYTAQIVFFGAELTRVWAEHFGSRSKDPAGAVRS